MSIQLCYFYFCSSCSVIWEGFNTWFYNGNISGKETVLGLGSPEFGGQIDPACLGHLQYNVINIMMEKN